jgi:four helix bundle protein
MISKELRDRTFSFALNTILFCRALPRTWEAQRIRGQLFDCGTSVGANYRAAGRARSAIEFIAKLGTVIEEADESEFWLDLLREARIDESAEHRKLTKEAGELRAIFVASRQTAIRTAQRKREQKKQQRAAEAAAKRAAKSIRPA